MAKTTAYEESRKQRIEALIEPRSPKPRSSWLWINTWELELPVVALHMVIVAPYQVMSVRGKQEGAIISLAIAAYMTYQHFSRTGRLNQSFDQGSIVATLAIICIVVMSCFLLF